MQKIWEIDIENDNDKSPLNILNKYARLLHDDTDGDFEAKILTTFHHEELKISIYICVPILKYYSYKLLEITSQTLQVSDYPVKIQLFSNISDHPLTIYNVDESSFETELIKIIKHPYTKKILGKLKKHIDQNES